MATKSRKKSTKRSDLPDSPDDIKHLQPDEGTLDLPDVKDIPGQEHVRPKLAGEIADVTISSADEEGAGILDDSENEISQDTNVSNEERDLLQQSSVSMASGDDQALQQAKLDNKDDEGTLLNEKITQSGSDLDVPGTNEDDSDEEDEENDSYSLNDDKEDDINTLQ
jgi:hypothetical protein